MIGDEIQSAHAFCQRSNHLDEKKYVALSLLFQIFDNGGSSAAGAKNRLAQLGNGVILKPGKLHVPRPRQQ